MAHEPFWVKYIDAAERTHQRAEEIAHISELTFALDSCFERERGTDCA
jgi:hypothetical protein